MADRRVDAIEHIASIVYVRSLARGRVVDQTGREGEGGGAPIAVVGFPAHGVTTVKIFDPKIGTRPRVAPALHTPQAIGRGPESRETRATTERAGEPRGVAGMAYDERAGAIEVRPARHPRPQLPPRAWIHQAETAPQP